MAPSSDEHDSGVMAEEPAVTPGQESGEKEHPDVEPSIPAGEAEAPVAPTAPEDEPQPTEDADEETSHHEQRLERDLDELTAKAEKADEYLDLAKRTKADFENYRKRAAREAAAAQERGVAKLVRELLPAVDNLDRALEAIVSADPTTNGEDFVSGIKLVHAELIAALARAGVERFDPEGEQFDPECHEALGQSPVQGTEAGTILEVYQRGYRLGDSVIRPARVLVAG